MKVYLLAATGLREGVNAFLADRKLSWAHSEETTGAELAVEVSGRVCYMSFGDLQFRRSTRDYIENLLKQGHESVLEHASFTLLIDGISRALTHQLVRHRAGFAYSQLSQQYHDEAEAEFVEPAFLQGNLDLRKQWEAFTQQSRAMYRALRDAAITSGRPSSVSRKESERMNRAVARLALPNATATTIVITGNARAWRHVLRVRGNIVGDLEMRAYCVEVFRMLLCAAPGLFSDFEVARDTLGEYVRAKSGATGSSV